MKITKHNKITLMSKHCECLDGMMAKDTFINIKKWMLKMLVSYYGIDSSHNGKFLYLPLLQLMLLSNDKKM